MGSNLNALIVDDEENARILLTRLLEETLLINEIRSSDSVDEALSELKHFQADIVFLDIKMPGKDGFVFIQEMPESYRNIKIVFVTAYDQYAIKAIKNQAFDYLLKPMNRLELKECITRFIQNREDTSKAPKAPKIVDQPHLNRIRVNTRSGTFFINPADILFCKAEGNYTSVCTGSKHYLCSMNLGKVVDLLPGSGFIRIGRSYIINFEHITMLDRKECTIHLTRDNESVKVQIPKQHLKDLDNL
jgi:two-component system, LytTR family, response regulator